MSSYTPFYFFLLLFVLSCGSDKKPSEGGTFADQAQEIESKSDLSAACEKDLKKYSEMLDEAKEYMQKQVDGYEPTKEDEEEWANKAKDLAKEMMSSAMTFTDPKCAMAFQEIHTEFTKVSMEMAKLQMQQSQ